MRSQTICRRRASAVLTLSILFPAIAGGAPRDSVTVAIDTRATRPLRPGLLGCNQNFMTRPYGYETPQVIALTRELRLSLLRYPAGGQSNIWDWEAADYMPAEAVAAMRQAQHASGFQPQNEAEGGETAHQYIDTRHPNKGLSVDSFMAFCARMDPPLQPLWVANVLTGSPEKSAAWVAYNKQKGYPNGLWELGNEHYLRGSKFKYPTAADYLREGEAHAKAMRAADPTARISVTAAEIHKLGSFQGAELSDVEAVLLAWNEGLAKGSFYDSISVHDYFPISQAQALAASEDTMYRFLMARVPVQFPILVDYYRKTFGADVKMWITEWNISPLYKRYGDPAARRSHPVRILKSLAHCLYVADWLLTATDYPDTVELACLHVLAADYARGLFGGEPPEEQNLDKPFVRTPPFQAMRMLGKAWQGSDATAAPALEGVEGMSGGLDLEDYSFPAMTVRVFLKGRQPRALVAINKSAEPRALTVTVDGKPLSGKVWQETLTAPERIEGFGKPAAEDENRWRPNVSVETRNAAADPIVAPAYSLSVIRLVGAPGD